MKWTVIIIFSLMTLISGVITLGEKENKEIRDNAFYICILSMILTILTAKYVI
jgi:hypothetical protein